MDFQALNMLESRLERSRNLQEFGYLVNSMLVSFKGHNVFSIFDKQNKHDKLLKYILKCMSD